MSGAPALAGLAAAAAVLLVLPGGAPPSPAHRGGRWWLPVLPAVAGLAALGFVLPAGLLLVAALVAVTGRSLLARRRRRRDAAQTTDRVLETCELVAADLVAGQSPVVALRRASEEWPALATVAEAAELGSDPARALAELADAPGAGDLRLVAAAWTVAHRTGGGLADALDRVAATLRDRRATARVVASELASARATARLVAALPVAMLLLGGRGSGAWAFLLGSPAGLACLAAGLALGLAGLAWIERIADGVTA
jgi:tight adherence protein B